MGYDGEGQLGIGTVTTTNLPATNQPVQVLGAYNRLADKYSGGTYLQFYFVGIANANYALEGSTSLSAPDWNPQWTNIANSYGVWIASLPIPGTNCFWRIRSAP
jgi:hypothetical protein